MNPKSTEILSKWLNGITIYEPKKKKILFAPPKSSKKRELRNDYVDHLKVFDCFSGTHFKEFQRLNILARSIIVIFLLLIIVGTFHEHLGIVSILAVIIVVLVLLYVLIPNVKGQIKSRLPRTL